MRHRKAGLKLNRTSSHRNAMFRNMVTSLFKHERIRTTDVKAKELRRWADNLITLAKRGDVHARRQALSIVREKDVVHKLFAEATERYGARSGGYTRIIKLGRRPGDAAPISLIELVFSEDDKKKKKKKKKSKAPIDKKKADKKLKVKEEAVEKTPTSKKDIEKKKAGKEEKITVEGKKEKTKIEHAKAEDKATVLESDASDSDEESKEQVAAPVDTEDAEKTKTEAKKTKDKKEDTESEA